MPEPRPLKRQLDHFAEMLSQTEGTARDGDVQWIAVQMGLPALRGNSLLRQLRAELGRRQAV